MNPFEILNIEPVKDKMVIRRAYVRETKLHHPDQGGDPEHFQKIQDAYDLLVNSRKPTYNKKQEVMECEVRLSLSDLLYGCEATVLVEKQGKPSIVQVRVPPYSYPGTYIEFDDTSSTGRRIRVKLNENQVSEFSRLDSNIVVKRQINSNEAKQGTDLVIDNFDGQEYVINVSANTSADRLIYSIPNAGFFEKDTKARGCLTIIVEIQKEGR